MICRLPLLAEQDMTTKDNFIYLTIALTTLLLSTALAQQFFDPSAQRLVQSTTVITLLSIVWGAKNEKLFLRKAFIFPVAIVLTSLGGYWLDNVNLEYAHLLLLLVFFIFTAIQTTKLVMLAGKVDSNKILGAICLYLLLGLIWALIYTLIELNIPGSFKGLKSSEHWFELFPTFVYFSFVTLTTLGFGDIAPTLPLSQFFVYFQAVCGQFYLAILVASMVGSRISAISNKHAQRFRDRYMQDQDD